MESYEDVQEANLSGTCNRLARRTERRRSDRHAAGLSGLGNGEDGIALSGFAEIKIKEEDKARGTTSSTPF